MANKKECEICKKMTKNKHKNDIVWKILAIVFMIISIVFICLYFCNGEVVVQEEYTQENIIDGDCENNQQSNIIELKDDSIAIALVIGGMLIGGGILGGCAIYKKKNQTD